jgi:hypothetical protein
MLFDLVPLLCLFEHGMRFYDVAFIHAQVVLPKLFEKRISKASAGASPPLVPDLESD